MKTVSPSRAESRFAYYCVSYGEGTLVGQRSGRFESIIKDVGSQNSRYLSVHTTHCKCRHHPVEVAGKNKETLATAVSGRRLL